MSKNDEPCSLKQLLLRFGKTEWIDIGCGRTYDDGFRLIDTYPAESVPQCYRPQYASLDILRCSQAEVYDLGRFDFVRMHHVFEHFTPDDGRTVLRRCAMLLRHNGILLVTVPDLRKNVERYLDNSFRTDEGFTRWSQRRIPADSPASFYFSMFAHGSLEESHRWCYDFEGLRYQIASVGQFYGIRSISPDEPLASFPLTYSRPDEEVCVIAQKLPERMHTSCSSDCVPFELSTAALTRTSI